MTVTSLKLPLKQTFENDSVAIKEVCVINMFDETNLFIILQLTNKPN